MIGELEAIIADTPYRSSIEDGVGGAALTFKTLSPNPISPFLL
jgi:hypothetical protein